MATAKTKRSSSTRAARTTDTLEMGGAPDTEAAPVDEHAMHDAHAAECGCGAQEDGGRRAVAVDAGAKARNRTRLRRIEGQVRGLERMVEEERYCADILTQIASVHEALRAVGRELMRNHLRHCATQALRTEGPAREAMYDELVDMLYKHSR